MGQTERVLRIQQMLRERAVISRRAFLDELEISPAQFKRDLAFLRDRFQLQIAYDPVRRGYALLRDAGTAEFELSGPMYTAREIYALLLMQDLIDQLQPGLLDEHIGPLRERLKRLLGQQDLRSDEIRRRIRILHMASRPVEPRFFRLVSQATFERRRLAILYFGRSRGDRTERVVSPQRLVFYRANWYLDAWCHLRNALRSFAVDAIENAAVTADPSREIETQTLDAHLGAGYGIFAGASEQTATLRFEPGAALYVAAEQWHARQTQSWEPGGRLLLTVPFFNHQELVMDILRYGPDVEVLAPEWLRDSVRRRLADARARY